MLVGLVAVVLGVGAWYLRVDDIPDELPPVVGDPATIDIPAAADQAPQLRIADLHGKTAFFIVFSPSMDDKKEGQKLNRALNRWILPANVEGHIVADAEGFGLFQEKVKTFIGAFAGEMRFPLHVDYEGIFRTTFALTKGHHNFVVLGPDGAILERRSGGAEGADLERIREMLGGQEPPVGPPMPEFEVGGLSSTSCGGGTPCAIIFLAKDVAKTDVPGAEGGFDGEDEEAMQRMKDPSIRMVSTAMKAKLGKAKGVLVGRTPGIELPTWLQVDEDADGRAAFGLGPNDPAFIVIDDQGRVDLLARESVPVYKWGRAADVLGVELDEDDD
jgi:hypothetical protein